jgi:hypothetical protein
MVDDIVEYCGEQVRNMVSIPGASILFMSAIAFSYSKSLM